MADVRMDLPVAIRRIDVRRVSGLWRGLCCVLLTPRVLAVFSAALQLRLRLPANLGSAAGSQLRLAGALSGRLRSWL